MTTAITQERLERAARLAAGPVLEFEFGRQPGPVSIDGGAVAPRPAGWQLLYHRLWCWAHRKRLRRTGDSIATKREAEFFALAEALAEEGSLKAGETLCILRAAEAGADWREALREHRAGEAFG